MNKIIGALIIALGLVGMATVAQATPEAMVAAENSASGKTVIVPARAVEVSPNLFSLGSAIDPQSGKKVEGYMIVHPKKGNKKPDNPGGGNGNGGGKPGGGDTTSSCYGFLAKGAKWKGTAENWVVDATNTVGLNKGEVLSILEGGVAKWNDAAETTVVGTGAASSTFQAGGDSMDGTNGVTFGSIANSNTIAVTTVWGIFGGKPANRVLVEWDQVYNQDDFTWNTDESPNDMDFDSIATHELGHSFGLADLYTGECSEETMYGYGSEGEIYARDLNAGDIAGISKLY